MSQKKKRGLTPEEKSLWDSFVSTVKRNRESESIKEKAEKTEEKVMERREEYEKHETLSLQPRASPLPPVYTQPKLPTVVPPFLPSRQTTSRLRKVTVEARIDLHDLTQDQAYARLTRFIAQARHEGKIWLLVITGKGRPGRPGVIRQALPEWLNAPPLRYDVAEFRTAKPYHGGDGAFYVRLKSLKKDQ